MRGRRNVEGLAVVAAVLLLASCAEDLPPRSYVQTNVVEKSLFQGEWYYSWTVIDNRYTSTDSDALGTYVGDTAMDWGSGWAVARIRWVIDEDFVYAFRSHELVRGGNPDGESGNVDEDGDGEIDGYRGEPVAAFSIQSHFDIQRQYNPTTGEEMNVIEENTIDRRWYERSYMRVDWSANRINGYNVGIQDIYTLPGLQLATWEASAMFVQPGSEVPETWQPQFEFTTTERPCAEGAAVPTECSWHDSYRSQFWDEHGPNQLYYMSFVTQEILTPGPVQDPYTGQNVLYCQSIYSDAPYCTSSVIVKRHAFMKISPEHDYEPALHEDNDFERFGLFRIERPTYDRVDPENPADPRLGRTDYLDYYSVLHNIWQRHTDDEGNPLAMSERESRPLHVWLTPGWPSYLVRTGLANAGEWGEVFMRLARANRSETLPDQYYDGFECETNAECREEFGHDSNHRSTCDQAVGQCRRPYNPYRHPGSEHFYPGDYDCWIGLRPDEDNPEGRPAPQDPMGTTPHDPDNDRDAAEHESDFDEDYNLVFNGSECMLVAHVNSCDYDDSLPCEERGDMRYAFFSFVFSADTPFLGVATMRGDPITGEFVTGDANFATWDMGWYRTRALQEYDILTGNLTEEQLMTGEDVRGMIDDLGRVIPPVRPLRDEMLELEGEFPAGFSKNMIDRRWDNAWQRAQKLRGSEGRQAIYSDRIFNFRDTDIERMFFDNPDTLVAAGAQHLTEEAMNSPVPDQILDVMSPMRTRLADVATMMERRELERANRGECFAEGVFSDYSVARFVEEHRNYTRPQLTFMLDRHVLNETLLHEYGHVIGLRHNFTGTVDARNFHPEYHEIIRDYPLPSCSETDLAEGDCVGPDPRAMNNEDDYRECVEDPDSADCRDGMMNYDVDGNGVLNRDETRFLTRAQANVRRWRELAGMEQYWTSSLMDYTPSWYHRLVGLGRWDSAAVLFNYGRLVEVYDNTGSQHLDPAQLNSADGVRELWRYYSGGERCTRDSDCPYSDGGEMVFDMTDHQRDADIYQQCLTNPQFEQGPGYCSNTYDDIRAVNAEGDDDIVAVEYRFCTDDRVADQSDCNRMDEGASYREIVMNARENYHRQYFWNNFRRFRRDYPGSYFYRVGDRLLGNLTGIYQHMYYRWASEGDDYRYNTGALGFYDQYMASVDVMNFFAEVMAQPNVGAYYQWPFAHTDDTRFRFYQENIEDCQYFGEYGGMCLYPGVGKYYRSDYRQGINGVFYVERLGVILDKFWALEFLSSRWNSVGMPYTLDEAYFVNFYDAFPEEMSYLFGHYASDQIQRLAPRVTFDEEGLPNIEFLDLWQGDCSYREGVECNAEPDDGYTDTPFVEDDSYFYMQYYGLIDSLANFPVYWDASWERQLHLYTEGGVDGIAIVDCADEPGDPDCLDEGADYVRFTSERFHRNYVAFAMESDSSGQRGESYMFNMLMEAVELQDQLAELNACVDDPEHPENPTCGYAVYQPFTDNDNWHTSEFVQSRWRNRLSSLEGYIRYVLQVQRDMGIASWYGY